MPVAKIHVLEGQYNEARLGKVSGAVQNGLISALGIPPEDFFQIIHVLPRGRFLHTPSSDSTTRMTSSSLKSPSSPAVPRRSDWRC
jgi:hypothetical protein